MKVAFLVGSDSASTRRSIDAACRVSGFECVGVLLDTARPSRIRRLRNLRRHIRREGLSYLWHRPIEALANILDYAAQCVIPADHANSLLRNAFPDRAHRLADLAGRHGFAVIEVENLNSAAGREALRGCGAELGVVLGTRILRRSTFSIPALGCINLHKGRVPEYRGLPPGFWELYDGASTAGVTVHFVDRGLDTGDIVGTAEVPIHANETVASLQTKLHWAGANLLADCLARFVAGTVTRTPQARTDIRPRTQPTRSQQRQLAHRRPGVLHSPSHAKAIV